MAKQYSIAEAKNRLPAIVHDAERGKPVHITRRGKPVAVLLSVDAYEHLARTRPDFWSALQAFNARGGADVDVDEVFDGTRDRAPGRAVKW